MSSPELIIFCVIATLSCVSAAFVIASTIAFRMYKTRTNRLLLALWVADFLQSIGTQISYTWIPSGIDVESPTCTFQGFLINFADLSTTFWVCVIALHTVMYGIYNVRYRYFETIAHVIVWGAAFFFSVIGFAIPEKNGRSFYGSVGYWCWIQSDYGVERMTFHYAWIFFLWGVTLLLYGFMGFRILSISRNTHLSEEQKKQMTHNMKRVARRMAGYPLLFFLVFGPLGIDRIARLAGRTPPKGYFYFAMMMFGSNGLLNALFYGATRNLFSRYRHCWRDASSDTFSGNAKSSFVTSSRIYSSSSSTDNNNNSNSEVANVVVTGSDKVGALDTSDSNFSMQNQTELAEVVTQT